MNTTILDMVYDQNNFNSINIPYDNIAFISISDTQIRVLVKDSTAALNTIIRKKNSFPSDTTYYEKVNDILENVKSKANVGLFNIINIKDIISDTDKVLHIYDDYFIYRRSSLNMAVNKIAAFNDGISNYTSVNCLKCYSLVALDKIAYWYIPVWDTKYYDPLIKLIGESLHEVGKPYYWDDEL